MLLHGHTRWLAAAPPHSPLLRAHRRHLLPRLQQQQQKQHISTRVLSARGSLVNHLHMPHMHMYNVCLLERCISHRQKQHQSLSALASTGNELQDAAPKCI
jgi:hypothetical protein